MQQEKQQEQNYQHEKIKVAFDIDFTMTTEENFKRVFGELYPGFDVSTQYTHYPVETSLHHHGFIPNLPTQQEMDDFHFYQNREKEIFSESPLEPWFIHVYERLKNNPGIEIFFITARNKGFEPQTHLLFSQHNLPTSNLHHHGGYNKEELINKYGIHFLFEDNLRTVKKVSETSPHCHSYLVDRLYNQDETLDPSRITRFDPTQDPNVILTFLLAQISTLIFQNQTPTIHEAGYQPIDL